MTVLHLRGVCLPDDEERDLWIADGVVRTEPVRGAETVVRDGYVVPGLVDAHCHIGLDANGGVDRDEQERQALAERDAGVLLARDCGVPADTRWIDERADLPRIIRAGQHVARPKRYIRNYGVEVEPHELVETVAAQAARGDGWVKIVGDWIDRDEGDLRPCWPREELAAAVARAHELGARVTTHVFGEDAVLEVLAAGVDCIEHATGMTDDAVAQLAQREVPVVPTLINIDNFPAIAAAASRFPAYAEHMLRLHSAARDRVAAAYEAGVPLFAGTDAGGALAHGRIADEVEALHDAGLPAVEALAAASWRARSWLGLPEPFVDGAPADFVVFDTDPRADLGVLRAPRRVVLRGVVVG